MNLFIYIHVDAIYLLISIFSDASFNMTNEFLLQNIFNIETLYYYYILSKLWATKTLADDRQC